MHPLNLALGQAAAIEGAGRRDPRGEPGGGDRGRRRAAGGADGAGRGAAGGADSGGQRLSRPRGAGAREPGDAVLDADDRDDAARARRGAGRCRPTWRSRTCATCSTTTGCRPTGGCSSAAARSMAAPIPADIRAKLVPNLERVFPQLKGVGVDFAWSGNCAISFSRVPQLGRLGPAHLFRAGLQRARGGRQPPLRAHPRRGGGWRPVAVRRLRRGAVDAVPGRAPIRRALFRPRIVVVWLARSPRRVNPNFETGWSDDATTLAWLPS